MSSTQRLALLKADNNSVPIRYVEFRGYIHDNPVNWEMDRENPSSKNFNLEHSLYCKEIMRKEKGSWTVQILKG